MPIDPDATAGHPPHPDGRLDDHDRALLRRLAALWQVLDVVPAPLVSDVTFAVALEEVYAEVASIQQFSSGILADARGTSDVARADRTITFSTGGMGMTIMVVPSDRGRVRIDGWVEPLETYDVLLRILGETRRAAAEDGRFCFHGVPMGSIQLLVRQRNVDDGDVPDMITPAVDLSRWEE